MICLFVLYMILYFHVNLTEVREDNLLHAYLDFNFFQPKPQLVLAKVVATNLDINLLWNQNMPITIFFHLLGFKKFVVTCYDFD